MKLIFACVAATLFSLPNFAANIEVLREYEILESSPTLEISNDQIIAGRTGDMNEKSYFIEVYDSVTRERTKNIAISHRPQSIDVLSNCQIAVFGAMSVSEVDLCTGSVTSKSFGANLVSHGSITLGGGEYLISEPNEGLLTLTPGRRFTKIGRHIAPLFALSIFDNKVWATNYSNLLQIDPAAKTKTPMFDNYAHYGFSHMKHLSSTHLVLSVYDDKKLMLFNKKTQKTDSALQLKWHPGSITTFGRCLAVSNPIDKEIVIFEGLEKSQLHEVGQFDLSKAGDKLKTPEFITYSQTAKTFFVKSAAPCPTCSVTQSSLVALILDSTDLPEQCF